MWLDLQEHLKTQKDILTQEQLDRFEEAKTAKSPVMIVNQKRG